jgi:hypothetical protein
MFMSNIQNPSLPYRLVAIAACAILSACGGGGAGGGNSGSQVSNSGVALDGYLYKATAYLDLNNNGNLDTNEPQSITDASGRFTLNATSAQLTTYPIRVMAVAGTTIDQDNPTSPISAAFTLTAPVGSTAVISPITTLVAAKISQGASLADAQASVRTELGLASDINIMKDFVAEKAQDSRYAQIHNLATSLTEVLQRVEATSSGGTTLDQKIAALRSNYAQTIVPNATAIKNSATPAAALSFAKTKLDQNVILTNKGFTLKVNAK